jgi:diguanylate cyclase (GGDEF)-like protein
MCGRIEFEQKETFWAKETQNRPLDRRAGSNAPRAQTFQRGTVKRAGTRLQNLSCFKVCLGQSDPKSLGIVIHLSSLSFSSLERRRGRLSLRQHVRVATVLVCFGLLLTAGILLAQARASALSGAEVTTRNLVGMLMQHTERTFDSVDMLLKVVARELGPRPEDPIRKSELAAKVAHLAVDLPHIMSVRLLDPSNEAPAFEFFRTVPTGRSADAEALSIHAANHHLGLQIGHPYFDQMSKAWVVGVSRRVSGQDGVPGLVVQALLNLEYLNSFYSSLDMGKDASISVIRTDGIMIARRPFNAADVGKDVSKALWPSIGDRAYGNYEITALTDHIRRIYGFRRLERIPLVLTVGLSEADILAEWRKEAKRAMGIAGIAALILLLLGEALARLIGHREKAERDLIHAAKNDSLTGLSNRAAFQEQLDALVANTDLPLCVLLLDLDEFKSINDTLGHDAGDALLSAVAVRLTRIVPNRGIIARLGGDEFAIVVPDALEVGRITARSILAALRQPFPYQGQTVMTAASIGIAVFPEHGQAASELLKNADIAMYSAKEGERGRYAIFEPSMRTEIIERIALHEDVKKSIENDLFVPFYQPQISLRTGEIQGFEALARWRHPEKGLLGPAAFGSAFDNHELAIAMGRKLFRKILADVSEWMGSGLVFRRVAVNASAAELDHPDYASWVLNELQVWSIPVDYIEIEVTEGVLFGRTFDRVQANLLRLHGAGIRIALDDFGTGYASLTHLKRFPISAMKIDRGFVHNLESEGIDASIVTAVADLARALKVDVIAEGVEQQYQVDFLKKAGCTGAQGYFFAKPMAASRVPHFIEDRMGKTETRRAAGGA